MYLKFYVQFIVLIFDRYTNKTYRVDDINWEQNPTSKFKSRDGSEMSYVEYYKKVRMRGIRS